MSALLCSVLITANWWTRGPSVTLVGALERVGVHGFMDHADHVIPLMKMENLKENQPTHNLNSHVLIAQKYPNVVHGLKKCF